jgi:hypothetical protein
MSGFRWTQEQLADYQAKRGQVKCVKCGVVVQRKSPMHRYCEPCSATQDRERKTKWQREHPRKTAPDAYPRRRSRTLQRGAEINAEQAGSISGGDEPQLQWLVRVSVPFSYAGSKNHIYNLWGGGHVALRRESKGFRAQISAAIGNAIAGRALVQNKLWVDIHVQKPNHKGDAINFVDLVCDAIKDASGLDDRWYSIRRVDWEVVKTEPMLYVGIGQEFVEDAQVCSSCGRVLPLQMFSSNRSNKRGVARNCKDCSRVPAPAPLFAEAAA